MKKNISLLGGAMGKWHQRKKGRSHMRELAHDGTSARTDLKKDLRDERATKAAPKRRRQENTTDDGARNQLLVFKECFTA